MTNISSEEATRYTNLLVGAQIRKTFLENKPEQDKFGRLNVIPGNFHSEIEKIAYCDIDNIKNIIDHYLDEKNEKIRAFFEPEELQLLSNVTDSNVGGIRELLIERFKIVLNNEIALINWFCERLESVNKEVFNRLSFSLDPYLQQYIEKEIELDSKTREALINKIDFTLLPWRSDLFDKLIRKHRDKDEESILEFINENELKYIRRLGCTEGERIPGNHNELGSYIYWNGDESIKKPYQNIALKSPDLYNNLIVQYSEVLISTENETSNYDDEKNNNPIENKYQLEIISETEILNFEHLESYKHFKRATDLVFVGESIAKEIFLSIIQIYEKGDHQMITEEKGVQKFNWSYLERKLGVDRRKIQKIVESNRQLFKKSIEVLGY